jgi:hypothetical protein
MARATTAARKEATGTYKFDRRTGKMVQVSSGVPKVASKGRSSGAAQTPCGRSACSGGRCAS